MHIIHNLLIGSLVALLLQHASQADQPTSNQSGWGHLFGQLIVKGTVPQTKNEDIPTDLAICIQGELGIRDDSLRINPNGGIADIFIMLVPDKTLLPSQIHPSYQTNLKKTASLEFKNCRLRPHALMVQTGQELVLKNNDDVGHHCQIDTLHNNTNLLVARQSQYSLRFPVADPSPGIVRCGIHKWIDAVILIKEHPYSAITNADGFFQIDHIPSGKWKFKFWHSRMGYLDEMQIPGFEVNQQGEIVVAIRDGSKVDLGQIMVPSNAINE